MNATPRPLYPRERPCTHCLKVILILTLKPPKLFSEETDVRSFKTFDIFKTSAEIFLKIHLTAFKLLRYFLRAVIVKSPGPRLCLWIFRNKIRFNGEDLLAPRPTPMMGDHPLSAVRDCLFNIFSPTLHIGGRSSIRNLRTRHSVVTGTPLSLMFRKWDVGVWTASSWLRIGTGGGHL